MTEWTSEGETWIPFNDVKKIYKVRFEELTILVKEGKVRCRNFLNNHNDKIFKAYSIIDLDEYIPKKEKEKIKAQWF